MSLVRSDFQGAEASQPLVDLPKCVLLAGSARGGTSWALKVLDSHPAVCGSHEPFYQASNDSLPGSVLDRLKAGQGTEDDARQLILKVLEACVETRKPPFFPKQFLLTPGWLQTLTWTAARLMVPLDPVFRYLCTGQLDHRHRLVIKNRPFPKLERISEAIAADNLLLLRHPCAVVSSWLHGVRMGVMHPTSTDPAACWDRYIELIKPIGFTLHQLLDMSPAGVLAVNWLVDTVLFRQYENTRMRTRTVVYEDLVNHPLEEWGQILEWMGLSMCDSVETFLTRSSQSGIDLRRLLGKRYTYFSVKRTDKSPVNAWRTQLSFQETDEVLKIIAPHFSVDTYWPEGGRC